MLSSNLAPTSALNILPIKFRLSSDDYKSVCYKENANERNVSLLTNCRVQLFIYKVTNISAE